MEDKNGNIFCCNCELPILPGDKHINISRNLEFFTQGKDENTIEYEVLDSINIVNLCLKCGDAFDENTITQFIKLIHVKDSIKNKIKRRL